MKKYFNFAFAGAIALLGATMFTGCSGSDDAVAENNPKYNATTGEVGVDFVMNVSSGSGTTRMTADNTQATTDTEFRGINNAVLLSFKQTADEKHISAATNADKRYELQDIMSAGSIDQTNSHRVIETSLPLNTNSLIFYGKAIQPTPADYEAYGHLENFTIADPTATGLDMSKTNIELASRINGNLEDFQKMANDHLVEQADSVADFFIQGQQKAYDMVTSAMASAEARKEEAAQEADQAEEESEEQDD